MEPYVMCQNCGEKISTNFSYCTKCGAEISSVEKTTQSTREIDITKSIPEKAAIDSIQLPASESTEVNLIEEEKEIIVELEQLHDSPLAGRIITLLLQLEKIPSLSPRTHGVVDYYKTHSNEEVKTTAKRILVQRFAE